MGDSEKTQIRISKARNERLKVYADAYGVSVADFAERSLDAVFALLEGDHRLPLLVAEYELKASYREGAGKRLPKRKQNEKPAS